MASAETNQANGQSSHPKTTRGKRNRQRVERNPLDDILARITSSDTYLELERDENFFAWLDVQRLSRTCGYVTASHGSGLLKSCQLYCRKRTTRRGGLFATPVRAAYLEVCQPGEPLDLYNSALKVFGHPMQDVKDSLRSVRKRSRRTFQDFRLEMLLIGNAEFLSSASFNELDYLFNKLKINIVLAGTKRIVNNMFANESDDEPGLKNCLLGSYQFPDLASPEDSSDFVDVIDNWERKYLPESYRLKLSSDDDAVKYLYEKCDGLLEVLYNLLRRITIAALYEEQYSGAKLDAQTLYEILGAADYSEGSYKIRSDFAS